MARRYSHQLITAISFGITSGTITALGMLVGLDSATSTRPDAKFVIVTGLVVMAVADGLADACGLHVAEESEMDGGGAKHTSKEVWLTTIFTFFSVCGFILTFAIPILFVPSLAIAVPLAVAWGMVLLIIFNFYIAKIKNEKPIKIILEHILIAAVVIIISYWIGHFLHLVFFSILSV